MSDQKMNGNVVRTVGGTNPAQAQAGNLPRTVPPPKKQ